MIGYVLQVRGCRDGDAVAAPDVPRIGCDVAYTSAGVKIAGALDARTRGSAECVIMGCDRAPAREGTGRCPLRTGLVPWITSWWCCSRTGRSTTCSASCTA